MLDKSDGKDIKDMEKEEAAAVRESETTKIPETVAAAEEAKIPETVAAAEEAKTPGVVTVAEETKEPGAVAAAEETKEPGAVAAAEEAKAPEAVAAVKETKASEAVATVEVKETAKKAGYRSEIDGIEVDFELQYRDHETDMKDIAKRVTEDYARRGNDASGIELIQVYLKPTDFTAYYVINNSYEGKIPLF